MSSLRYNKSNLKSVDHHLSYFDQQVLAAYRNEPDKYVIKSDYFEGELTVTSEYFKELEKTRKTGDYINIRFGYRGLKNGDLAIVAWLPDLFEKSKTHVKKWSSFHLENPEWISDHD